MDEIQKIYVALFGRPADPAGLAYFAEETNDGADLSAIGDLAGTDEYQDRFEDDSVGQVITEIYSELFGRNPTFAEVSYWESEFNAGRFNINDIAIAIAQGALNADADLLDAKVAAANQFTAAVQADPDALAAYRGSTGEAAGRAFLDQVTSADFTLTDAQVAEQVAAIGSNTPPGGDGLLFNLVVGVDTFAPNSNVEANRTTTGDDRFEAAAGALQTGDLVDGGAGRDTLNAIVGAVQAPTVRNVEVINLTTGLAASVLDLANVTGAEQVNFVAAGANGDDLTLNNVALGTKIGFAAASALGSDLVVNFAGVTGTADAASVSLTGTNGVLSLAGIETVNLNAVTSSAVSLGVTTATAVNLSGAASTLNYAATVAATITGGANADTINAAGATAIQTISTGAGNDTITVDGNFAHSLTGGEGSDTFVINTDGVTGLTAANIASATALEAAAVKITDFSATDLLRLNVDVATDLLGTLTGTQLSNVAGQTDLLAATNAAIGFGAGAEVLEFQFGGHTYVVVDEDSSGALSANDALIQLTGVADLASSQLQLV